MEKTYLILFPGAWGNRTSGLVLWWFREVIRFLVNEYGGVDKVEIIPIVYHGKTLDDFADDTRRQLANRIPTDARTIAVGYSMGGQVLRLASDLLDRDFQRQIIFASSGRRGMRFAGFWRGLLAVCAAFTKGAFTGQIELTETEEVRRFFFNTTRRTPESDKFCRQVLGHTQPEPFWPCCQFVLWPFRVWMAVHPLNGKVFMILPEDDIMFRDELDDRGARGEDWQIIKIPGGHGAILNREAVNAALSQINWPH